MKPSPRFASSVAANVAYWTEQTKGLDREAIQEVDRDRQNLYRAADFGLGLDETWRKATELILQCYPFINERGYYRDWYALLERIVEACPEDDLTLKGRALSQLGIFYRRMRRLDEALAIHLEEEQVGLRSEDEERTAFAQMHIAYIYYRQHRNDRAMRRAQAALKAFRKIAPESEMMAASLNASGLIAMNRNNLEEAESWLEEAVELYRRLDNPLEMGRALLNLGNALENMKRYDEAVGRYHEAHSQFVASGNRIDETRLYMSLGTLLYHQGKLNEAEEVFRLADSEYTRQWDTNYQLAQIKMNLANVLLAQGKLYESEAYWRECIPNWREAGARLTLANSLGGLAETLVAKGDAEEAIALFDEALAILAEFPKDAWAVRLQETFSRERTEALVLVEKDGHPHPAE